MANLRQAFEYAAANPNSEFANNLKQLAASGSLDQEAVKYGIDLTPFKTKPVVQEKEKGLGTKLKENASEAADVIVQNAKDVFAGKKDAGSALLQSGGAVAKGVTESVGDVIMETPVVGDVVEKVAPSIANGIKAFQTWLENNPTFQNIVTSEQANQIAYVLEKHPEIANNAEAINEIANAVLLVKGGATSAGKVATGAEKVAVETLVPAAKTGAEKVAQTATKAKEAVAPVTDIAKSAYEGASRIPSRIKTNAEAKAEIERSIKEIPSVTGQTAARDGVEIADIQGLIASAPKTEVAKKLIQTVKDFAAGKTTTDPIEIVGSPIIQRVKNLEKTRVEVGKALGEASKNLGIVTKPELQLGVFNRLQSVPGLQDIALNAKGLLDFSKTTLASTLSKADRKAIQEAFSQATKWGSGEKAHLFRQELFEILGGKKKSLQNITDTQERAYEAIRSGLSDVLEIKNPAYKTLSNEYRKIVQPLQELRKLMKNVDPNSTEDILNMSAGLLARRITSAASSNPQIRNILKALDEAGAVKGKTMESVESLQDLYNVLNKYYDIAPRTGFQNLVKEGVNIPKGVSETLMEALNSFGGKTNAVRQKSFEKFLEELMNQ